MVEVSAASGPNQTSSRFAAVFSGVAALGDGGKSKDVEFLFDTAAAVEEGSIVEVAGRCSWFTLALCGGSNIGRKVPVQVVAPYRKAPREAKGKLTPEDRAAIFEKIARPDLTACLRVVDGPSAAAVDGCGTAVSLFVVGGDRSAADITADFAAWEARFAAGATVVFKFTAMFGPTAVIKKLVAAGTLRLRSEVGRLAFFDYLGRRSPAGDGAARRSAGQRAIAPRASDPRQTPIHFLHLGKTGGSAVWAALRPVVKEKRIIQHGHRTVLADIPNGEAFFFFVRHPVARFVSAFNSRQRRGQPRYNIDWTRREAVAFARFATPDALAVALSAGDEPVRKAAERAMLGIRHIKSTYVGWFRDEAYLRSRLESAVFVGLQEHLSDDFEILKERLALPAHIALPQDPIAAHQTPSGFSTTLGAEGGRNIERWYAGDIELYRFFCDIRERMIARRGA
jgi:hypothetical protein